MKEKIIPKKSLGQNFLKDETALKKIIEAAELERNDNILEIGPGTGALTEELLNRAGRVIMVEKDDALANLFAKNYKLQITNYKQIQNNKFQINHNQKNIILNGDILKINLAELIEKNNFQNYKIVANIPYYITGKLFRIIFEGKYLPELMVLTIQKEVAERICAKKGRLNKLALLVKYFGQANIIDIVPKTAFDPIPKVDSAIIKIKIKKISKYDQENFKKIFKLIRVGFSSPRKILLNNLMTGLKIEKNNLIEGLKLAKIKQNNRAGDLTLDEWKKLEKFVK